MSVRLSSFLLVGCAHIALPAEAGTVFCFIDEGHFIRNWQNELSVPSLIKHEPSPQPTSLSFVRTGLDGRVTGYAEVLSPLALLPLILRILTDTVQASNPRISTGLTSTSLDRAPGPSKNFVRGKAGNVPFWPGGLEDASSGIPEELEDGLVAERKGIRTIPPGFTRGLRLPGEEEDETWLEGLDMIPKHSGVGQGDAVSAVCSEPHLLGSGVSFSYRLCVQTMMVRLSSEVRRLMNYCRHP